MMHIRGETHFIPVSGANTHTINEALFESFAFCRIFTVSEYSTKWDATFEKNIFTLCYLPWKCTPTSLSAGRSRGSTCLHLSARPLGTQESLACSFMHFIHLIKTHISCCSVLCVTVTQLVHVRSTQLDLQ